MGENIDEKEVIDFSGENLSILPQKCSIILGIVVVVLIVGYILYLGMPDIFSGIFISLILLFLFIFALCYFSRTRGGIRKFVISDRKIEFFFPDREGFHIEWPQFDSIDICLKKLELKPYHVYNITFIKDDSRKTVKFSLSDFHKVKIKEILTLLKEYSVYNEKPPA